MNDLDKSHLARLSKRMFRVKPEHLDMGGWGCRTKCGTIGCVLGHAGLIPEFRALGLRTELKDDAVYYGTYFGFQAGAKFFGLTDKTAELLFNPDSYLFEESKSPKLIANRIDTLIDVGEELFAEMVEACMRDIWRADRGFFYQKELQ